MAFSNGEVSMSATLDKSTLNGKVNNGLYHEHLHQKYRDVCVKKIKIPPFSGAQ